MKTFKTTISKTKYVLLAMLIAFSFSCSPEDGKDGADGAPGTTGTTGQNGEDGNANVQAFIFNTPTWSSNTIQLTLSELTQDVLDNDVILGYWEDDFSDWAGTNEYYWGGYFRDYTNLTGFTIRAHNNDNTSDASPPVVNKVKIIIIESSSTTTGKTASKQQVYKELNQAGVNINDYYAVCDYYGIAY